MTPLQQLKDEIDDGNMYDLFMSRNSLGKIILFPFIPFLLLSWAVWILICLGGYLYEITSK